MEGDFICEEQYALSTNQIFGILNRIHEQNDKLQQEVKYHRESCQVMVENMNLIEYWRNMALKPKIGDNDSTLIAPISTTKSDPEILNWKQAARIWADGMEIQEKHDLENSWYPMESHDFVVKFTKLGKYRIKPSGTIAPENTDCIQEKYNQIKEMILKVLKELQSII